MNLSWLYFLPSFIFFILVILFFAAFSIGGFLLIRKYVERWLGKPPAQNEVISYYIAATGVVYGITLGLIAVGVWDNYIRLPGALIGALVFLIIVLDFPFRGWFKVSAEPFEYAYEQLMK